MPPEQRIVIAPRSWVIGIAIVLAVAGVPLVATFTSLTMLALILGAALAPGVKYFSEHFGLKREAAVTAVFTTMLVGVTGVALLVVPTVIDQIRTLAMNLPHYLEHLQGTATWLQETATRLGTRLGAHFPMIPAMPDLKAVTDAASANASNWVGSSLGIARGLVSLCVMGLLVLMLAFFFLLEGPQLRAAVLSLVPPPHRALVGAQIDPIAAKLGGYVQGMAVSIAALAVYQVIVLSALGLPLALALGLLSALMAVVPLVGGFLGVIPPALVGLSVSWQTSLWALVLGYLGHFLVANFVMPIVFARSVKLSPLMVTIALLVGGEAMGIFGALVAVPVAAALQVLVQNLYVDLMEKRHAPAERDALRFDGAPLPRLALGEDALEATAHVPATPTRVEESR